MRPTTVAASLILTAACVAAVVLYSTSSSNSTTPAAAHVGPSVVTTAQVEDEVDAILAVPAYRRALDGLGTLSLAAPVSPKAVAAANGDPDDLLITFAPAKGTSISRPFTRADLAAAVLTRLLYVTSLHQVLAGRHVHPTAAQTDEGRMQARVEAGFGPGGASIYPTLPAWYQDQLATRATDVEALAESVAGPRALNVSSVEAYYFHTALSEYTFLCLRRVSPAAGSNEAGANEGCAPMGDWTPDVASEVSRLPVGASTGPFRHDGKTIALTVTTRKIQPLAAVSGNVIAQMLEPYADVVDNLVTAQLGIEKVTVSSQYGTYEALGTTFGVLPPDAFNPPSPVSPKSVKRSPPPRQQFDPFS